MNTMNERRVLVVGGTRGLGLGVVQALVAEVAQVTVLAPRRPRRNGPSAPTSCASRSVS
jgi:NAD(P)-dependent dehydrogenase (short-subunit alcohol dehydrogenase family)